MLNLRSINQVRSQIPCDTPVTHVQDDMVIHDFNRAIMNISIRLAQDIMVDRIIGNIRVSMTKKEYAKITNKRHHSVTPELLVRNLAIGLENSKEALEVTIQYCIRSALLPLTRRYHTYFMSQCLRRLSCVFYVDTTFAKNHNA